MPDPGFARDPDTIDQALTVMCDCRARAIANRDAAIAAIETAERDVLLYESDVAMCDKRITGLLDERLAASAVV